jgi:tetratricopeptide (TPR) repeat protein
MSSSKAKADRQTNRKTIDKASESTEPDGGNNRAVFALVLVALVLLVVAVLVFRTKIGSDDATDQDQVSRTDELKSAIELSKSQYEDNKVLAYCYELAELAPDDVIPWLNIAEIYESRGLQLQLNSVYPKIIKRSPQLAAEYRRRMMHTLIEVGEAETARRVFDELKQESPRVLREDAVIEPKLLHLEGKVEDAETRLGEILANDATKIDATVLLGRIMLSKERPQETVRLLKPLAERQTTNAQLQYLLGTAYSALGNEDAAYQFLSLHRDLKVARLTIDKIHNYLKDNPLNVALAGQLAVSYATLGDVEEARYWQQVAIELRGAGPR